MDAAPGRSEPSGTAAVAVSPGSEMVAVAVRLVSGEEPPLVRLAIPEMVVLAAGQQRADGIKSHRAGRSRQPSRRSRVQANSTG
jgi:hypothetical protein